jgi:hypothetical protein
MQESKTTSTNRQKKSPAEQKNIVLGWRFPKAPLGTSGRPWRKKREPREKPSNLTMSKPTTSLPALEKTKLDQ